MKRKRKEGKKEGSLNVFLQNMFGFISRVKSLDLRSFQIEGKDEQVIGEKEREMKRKRPKKSGRRKERKQKGVECKTKKDFQK